MDLTSRGRDKEGGKPERHRRGEDRGGGVTGVRRGETGGAGRKAG